MLCDRILDNLDSPNSVALRGGRTIDLLDVTWVDLHRRAFRASTRQGRVVSVLLPLSTRLQHGDILHAADDHLIAVHLKPSDLIVGSTLNLRHMALVAFELGNLHFPVEIGDGQIATLWDGPAEGVFRRHEAPFRRETRRFTPLRASVLNNVRPAQGFHVDPARPTSGPLQIDES